MIPKGLLEPKAFYDSVTGETQKGQVKNCVSNGAFPFTAHRKASSACLWRGVDSPAGSRGPGVSLSVSPCASLQPLCALSHALTHSPGHLLLPTSAGSVSAAVQGSWREGGKAAAAAYSFLQVLPWASGWKKTLLEGLALKQTRNFRAAPLHS